MNEHYDTHAVIALIASIREQANLFLVRALSERGITDLLPAHGAVLNALFQRSPVQMNELAEAIGRKKNTVTGLIKTLEERGYCRREPDPQDARAQLVALTDKGETVRAEQAAISENLLKRVWEGVGEPERQSCIDVLRTILRNLRDAADTPQTRERL